MEPLWKALQGQHEKVGARLASVAPFRDLHDSWSKRRRKYEQYLSEPDTILLLADIGNATLATLWCGLGTLAPRSHCLIQFVISSRCQYRRAIAGKALVLRFFMK